MMALIQLIFLILATTFFKISESQSYGRNGHCNGACGGGGCGGGGSISRAYIPVVLTDQFPPHLDISSRTTRPTPTDPCSATVPGQSSTNTVLSNNDFNALLQLAKVLEADKTTCATKGIDVDKLLETLVKALVYTTTHTVETSMNRCNTPGQNDANVLLGLLGQNGLLDKLLSVILGHKRVSGVVSGVGGTIDDGSPHTVNKGLLGGVTGNDGLLGGVLDGVGGVLDGVGGVLDGVGGTLNGVGGTLNGVGGTLNGVGGTLNGVGGTLNVVNKTSEMAVDKNLLGGAGGNDGLLDGAHDGSGVVGEVGGIVEVYF